MKKKQKAKIIEPKEWYTMKDIHQHRMFPWISSLHSVRKIVLEDIQKKNILKTRVEGEGKGTKYHIKGENIIKFLK